MKIENFKSISRKVRPEGDLSHYIERENLIKFEACNFSLLCKECKQNRWMPESNYTQQSAAVNTAHE